MGWLILILRVIISEGTTAVLIVPLVFDGHDIGRTKPVKMHVGMVVSRRGLHVYRVLECVCLQSRLGSIRYLLHGGRLLFQVLHVLGRGQHLSEVTHELNVREGTSLPRSQIRVSFDSE